MNLRKLTYKTKTKIENIYVKFLSSIKNKLVSFTAINALLVLFQILYIRFRFEYINSQIPFWFTKLWGSPQLAPKSHLFYISALSFALLVCGLVLLLSLSNYYINYLHNILTATVLITNMLLTYSVIRIIFVASVPFEPLVNPIYLRLVWPFFVGYLFTLFFLPGFISWAKRIKLVTNPGVHQHPAMLLKSPSARGGGVFYSLGFLVLSFLFVGYQNELTGFYISMLMLTLLAFVDDYQNTHPGTDFRLVENPFLRLFFLFSSVSVVVISGIGIDKIGAFSAIDLSNMGEYISMAITATWIVWVMNLLSWSNGIDGQFGGIVGISTLILAVLALRFDVLEPIHSTVAVLAALSAGLSFGFTKYTWSPSKIMWGFGAMTAGLVISTLSILIQAKIITSMLIILIPFTDAVVTVFRRIIQKKNPLRGDKGHLHHILLARGWSTGKIALFYWFSTALFGVIGLLTSDKYAIQAGLIISGIVAFGIVLLNVRFYTKKVV